MTVDELAELLHVSVHHVRRLVFERRIPFLKIGSRVRFETAAVEEWLSTLRVDTYASKNGLVSAGPPRARSAPGGHRPKEIRHGEH
jgi:excisionase family DNA binding protein